MHPLFLKLLDNGRLAFGNELASEILRIDRLFTQNRLVFFAKTFKKGFVNQENLAIKVVIGHRQLVLRLIKRIGKDRENRIFQRRSDGDTGHQRQRDT